MCRCYTRRCLPYRSPSKSASRATRMFHSATGRRRDTRPVETFRPRGALSGVVLKSGVLVYVLVSGMHCSKLFDKHSLYKFLRPTCRLNILVYVTTLFIWQPDQHTGQKTEHLVIAEHILCSGRIEPQPYAIQLWSLCWQCTSSLLHKSPNNNKIKRPTH